MCEAMASSYVADYVWRTECHLCPERMDINVELKEVRKSMLNKVRAG